MPEEKDDRPRCDRCDCWVRSGEEERYGICHRYPPTALAVGVSVQLRTNQSEGCFEIMRLPEGKEAAVYKKRPETIAQARGKGK